MELVTRVAPMRETARRARAAGRRIALVPTMGALHAGHLSLVRRARELSDLCVVSIFVNPTQFAPGEDFESYPKDLARDAELSAGEGVDIVFAPAVPEMYPEGFSTAVEVAGLTEGLCGAARPGHFRGVATVVMKLLQIVLPDVAVFGAKDFQQAAVVRRMVRDLDVPCEIVVAPTVREPDGLAMSSRNAYLSPPERTAATALVRALRAAESAFAAGERDSARIEGEIRGVLESEPLAKVEYVSVVDAGTLAPVPRLEGETLVALAARVGRTRLIDNIVLDASKETT